MNEKTKPWWKRLSRKFIATHPALMWLIRTVDPDRAELVRLARPYKNIESRATKRKHVHKHRPTGSKFMKKTNRLRWNTWAKDYDASR